MAGIEVVELTEDAVAEAIGLCARAFRDSPSIVAMYGEDPLNRLTWNRMAFQATFRAQREPRPLAARYGEILLGVCGLAPSERCLAYLGRKLREAEPDPDAPEEMHRLREWVLAMTDHDPDEAHLHIGPVAVEVDLQGMGIGSRMLEALCAQMDEHRRVGWLETDKQRNVVLYERFGFEVTGEVELHGATNWFMRRALSK